MSCINCAYSQTIKGKIADTLNKPIPYSPVGLIRETDHSIYEGIITNDSGYYYFEKVKPGSYQVKVQINGYAEQLSPAFKVDSTSHLRVPDMRLKTAGIRLDEVTINALKKTVEFKNGNISVNIEDSPLAAGNTAYDLLSRLPGVVIDNDKISIQGREGVRVLINGRMQQLSEKQLMNLLKSISAATIEKIEILKNPPIKYDAAGTAGLINILLKKARISGLSGNVTTSASQGFYTRGESGFSLNYKAKKLTLFSSIFSEYGKWIYVNKFNRNVTYNGITTNLDQQHVETEVNRGFESNMGMDWFLNKRNTLGFKITIGPGKEDTETKGVNILSNNSGFDRLYYDNSIPDSWTYSNYNINAEHLLDTLGGKIIFSSDYSPNHELYRGNFDNHFYYGDKEVAPPRVFKMENEEQVTILSSKLDIEKRVSETFSFETGIKGSSQDFKRIYGFKNKDFGTSEYITDTAYTNSFFYTEQIAAGYVQADIEVGDFNLQLGLRGENTSIKAESPAKNFKMRRQYFNLFPLVSVEYDLNDKNNLQLSYNQRINRPDFYLFYPYKSFWVNILSSDMGNPDLLPEYSNTLEFTHTYKGKISNAFAWSRLDNYIMGYTNQNDSTRELIEYVANLKNSETFGYTFFCEFKIRNKWTFNGNLMASYNSYSGKVNDIDYSSSGFGYSANVSNELLLPKKFKCQVNIQYSGPKPLGIFTIQPRWALNLAVKRSFMKDKLDVTVGMDDIFYTYIGRNQVNFQNQNWKVSETNDSRRVKISLNFNFGKMKVEQRETSSNEEEKEKLKH